MLGEGAEKRALEPKGAQLLAQREKKSVLLRQARASGAAVAVPCGTLAPAQRAPTPGLDLTRHESRRRWILHENNIASRTLAGRAGGW